MVANLYQVAAYETLKVGAYDGSYPVAQLTKHGDFGLGTFNGLDGEMIVLDGVVHQVNGFGDVLTDTVNLKTPFAFVTKFRPVKEFRISSPVHRGVIESIVDKAYPDGIVAIRLVGRFADFQGRSFAPQLKPYKPFLTILDRQSLLPYGEVGGSLVGFRMPKSVAKGDRNVPGYHFHFLDGYRSFGGHVLTYSMVQGTIEIMPVGKIVPLAAR